MSDVTLAQLRAEMARLTGILMNLNANYLEREKEVIQLHKERHHQFTGELRTVLGSDLLLADYSGGAKTVATLAGAIAQIIQAEIAYERRFTPTSEATRQRIADAKVAERLARDYDGSAEAWARRSQV